MRKLSTTAVVVALAAAATFVGAPEAHAQEIQLTGPLAGAAAVRNLTLYREGRIALAPMGMFTINDEFQRHILVGGRVEYGLFDYLSIGVFGGYTLVGVPTRLSDEVKSKGVFDRLNFPYADDAHPSARDIDLFDNQLGLIEWVAGLQASIVPLRGKFSLFGRTFVDADVFLFLGIGAAGVRERGDVEEGQEVNPEDDPGAAVTLVSRTALAPTFGGGLNMYLNDFIAISLEYRMMPFSWNTSGTDEACSDEPDLPCRHNGDFPDGEIDDADALLHFNQFFNVGVIFHVPPRARVTD